MPIRPKSYQQQVEIDTPRVASTPNPGAVRGAFGENVYQANQAIGDAISGVGDALYQHGLEQKKLKNDAFVSDQESKANLSTKEALYNPEEETVKVEGKDVTRPKGFMNRMGLNSVGSTRDFQKWSTEYTNNVLKDIQDPAVRGRVQAKLGNQFESAFNSIISHEARETRKGNISFIKSNRDLKIDDSYSIATPDMLNKRIGEVATLQYQINQAEGNDEATSQQNLKDSTRKTVEKAISGAVNNDPTGTLAYSLLDGVKGNLPDEDYDELEKKVGVDSKKIISDNKLAIKQAQIQNEAGLINDFLSGNIDVADQENIKTLYQTGKIGEEFGKSIIKALTKPITEYDFDEAGNDQSFVDLATWALETKDPSSRNELITKILDGFNDSSLSQRNMTLLIQTSMKYGGIKDGIQQRQVRNTLNKVMNNALKFGQSDTQAAKDYLQSINSGKSPAEASKVILNSYGIKTDEEGNVQEETEPSKFGVQDIIQPVKSTKNSLEKLIDLYFQPTKGLIASIASTPQVFGAIIKEYGEAPEQNRNYWNDIFSPTASMAEAIINLLPGMKEARQKGLAEAVKIGDDLIDRNIEWIAQQGLNRPEGKGLDAVLYDLGSGAGSVAVAIGTTLVSKNPVAIAAMFGAMGKAHMYTEAREGGKTPAEASDISNVAGLADFGLQMVGLNFMLKNYGGRLINAGVRSGVLALQTGLQSVEKDVLSPWQNKDTMQIVQDAAYNAMIGVALGLGTSAIVDSTVKDGTVKKIKDVRAKTDFGRQLQKQMEDKENIPLHPAEAGRSEIERLYGKKDIEEKLIIRDIAEGIKQEMNPVMSEFEAELAAFENEGGATKTAGDLRAEKTAKDTAETKLDESLQAQAEGEGMVRSSAIDGEQVVESEAGKPVTTEKKSLQSEKQGSTAIEPDGQQGTGQEKQRGLSKSVEEDAVYKGLVDELGDLPTYQTRNMKEVAGKVEAFIKKDPELAKRIALGDAPEEGGIRSQEMFTGLKVQAEMSGDVNMLRDLALSDKATALATELGQRVKGLDSNNPDSPVEAIREVKRVREEVAKKRMKTEDISKEKKKIVKEIQKETKKTTPTKETWESFIKSVQC